MFLIFSLNILNFHCRYFYDELVILTLIAFPIFLQQKYEKNFKYLKILDEKKNNNNNNLYCRSLWRSRKVLPLKRWSIAVLGALHFPKLAFGAFAFT